MSRYLFHIAGTDPEPIECELADIVAAKREAAKTIGAILCDAGPCVWDGHDWGVVVTDENGVTLFTIVIAAFDATFASRPAPETLASTRIGA